MNKIIYIIENTDGQCYKNGVSKGRGDGRGHDWSDDTGSSYRHGYGSDKGYGDGSGAGDGSGWPDGTGEWDD